MKFIRVYVSFLFISAVRENKSLYMERLDSINHVYICLCYKDEPHDEKKEDRDIYLAGT